MSRTRKILIGAALAAVAAAAGYFSLPPRAPSAAALFAASFDDLSGRPQPLSQWRGKVLVLNFWAPWCPPCRREIPAFIRLQDKYRDRGVVFVGVAVDEPEKVRAFADGIGMNYPVLLGDARAITLARESGNRSGGLPFTLVVNRSGSVALSWVGELPEERLETALKPLL
ncbi:MAG: TlpA disulfide reductase family protein [Pseudomonadota bacterium]|jgi:thiol-disulfide isomerase/thioredoxin